jgi:hypothetical protein
MPALMKLKSGYKAAAAGDKLADGTLGATKMFRLFVAQQTGRGRHNQ